MYGLPSDFDPSIFLERRLDRVCFAQYVVFFYFTNHKKGGEVDELTVSVEASFVFRKEIGAPAMKQSAPIQSSDVMALVGHEVISAQASSEGTISISFDNDALLTFLDDNAPQYESYSISGNEVGVIV